MSKQFTSAQHLQISLAEKYYLQEIISNIESYFFFPTETGLWSQSYSSFVQTNQERLHQSQGEKGSVRPLIYFKPPLLTAIRAPGSRAMSCKLHSARKKTEIGKHLLKIISKN